MERLDLTLTKCESIYARTLNRVPFALDTCYARTIQATIPVTTDMSVFEASGRPDEGAQPKHRFVEVKCIDTIRWLIPPGKGKHLLVDGQVHRMQDPADRFDFVSGN